MTSKEASNPKPQTSRVSGEESSPQMRAERLARLQRIKAMVEDGTYAVPAEELADILLAKLTRTRNS